MRYKDDNGCFEVLGSIEENGFIIEYRKYDNSPRIKLLGGMYALCCEEKHKIRFYRNDYMAMHALTKFIKEVINDEN